MYGLCHWPFFYFRTNHFALSSSSIRNVPRLYMRHLVTITICVLQLGIQGLYSQDTGSIAHFKTGDKIFERNIDAFTSNPDIEPGEYVDGFYYRYIQFTRLPTPANYQLIEKAGIKLVEYIPDNTYLAAIPSSLNVRILSSWDIHSVTKSDTEDKMDYRLFSGPIPDWARNGNEIKVVLKAYPTCSSQTFSDHLELMGFPINKDNYQYPFYFASIPASNIPLFAAKPFIQYIEIGPAPAIPEDTGGRNLQRANVLNNKIPGDLRFDATGVNVMVRDDGAVGPHIDFKGRLIDFTDGAPGGTHGDGVAGVMAGAGNRNSQYAGSASGANVYVLNYNSTFTDNTIELHQSDNVVITNSSYSDGCNAGYTTTTQRVDQQMIDNPTLMHVFSGGNSNGNDCGYGAGTQWGNITGGHKQGKNVMAVANLNANGELVNSSSRGPAHDGRIKPDIAAHGQGQFSTSNNHGYQVFGGTSAAAPTMAGSMAQLYQVYRQMNGGNDPDAALLKAIILNTATDMGNIGPDFKFGWGRIDAFQAYKVIKDNAFLSGTISTGQSNDHLITVPPGVKEMRVMVYWRDPAASVNTTQALVNNLDAIVTDRANNVYLPWFLDATPNETSLDHPATKGVDMLNNMEQISITDPTAGSFTVTVSGTSVPMGGLQEYYVVYSFFYDEIVVTYPYGGESLTPGETTTIHWDAYGTEDEFIVSFSSDNGHNYEVIDNEVPGEDRLLSWVVPDDFIQAQIRVRRNGTTATSEEIFYVMNQVNGLGISDVCSEVVSLTWNPVDSADEYVIYQLADKYMEEIGRTSDQSFEVHDIAANEELWFAVQAVHNSGALGRRSEAVLHIHSPSLENCPNTVTFDKTVDSEQINAGDTVMYTLKFKSFFEETVSGVLIKDTLPANWKFIEGSLTCGTFENGIVSIGPLIINPGDSMQCAFKVRADVLLSSGIIFDDHMEQGSAQWTTVNFLGEANWTLSSNNPHSPSTSWYSPNIGSNNAQSIISNPVHIYPGSQLSFLHDYNTESELDGGFVEISINNGMNWLDLNADLIENGYNSILSSGSNPIIQNRPAFSGNSLGYIKSVADLSPYVNHDALFRFTLGENDNTNSVGWYIDDISVSVPYYMINRSCATYDQGEPVCKLASSKVLPCLTNCNSCVDGVQNGDESGIDCGGTLCAICPCTSGETEIIISDTVLMDDTNEKIKDAIQLSGSVQTEGNSEVELRAGKEVEFTGVFFTGPSSQLLINIDDCVINGLQPVTPPSSSKHKQKP